MLSYRHAFHAGNYADLLKHITLLGLIESLQKKDKGFTYIDTHAGAGNYSLSSSEAQKTGEFKDGIGLHLPSPALDAPLLTSLCDSTHCDDRGNWHYPGSPKLVADRLRPQDRAALFELHPTDYQALYNLLGSNPQIDIQKSDGFSAYKAYLPSPTRRALVLIDPSYELKDDYTKLPRVVSDMLKRMANSVIAIWYPVVDRALTESMLKHLGDIGDYRIDRFELGTRADSSGYGMTSAGMIVINSPWDLIDSMQPLITHLAALHSEDGDAHAICKNIKNR